MVPKGYDGMKMAPRGDGEYGLSAYMKNDEWGFALLFTNGKSFSEVGSDKSSSGDAGDKVESPLLGLPCAVRKPDGLTMREIEDDSIQAGTFISRVFGQCEAKCNATVVNATAADKVGPDSEDTTAPGATFAGA